jgi:hypothetical protein
MTSRGDSEIPRQEPERAKHGGRAQRLREQFRQLAQSLTPPPAPLPTQRRRRTEDTGRAAFQTAARSIVRRTVRIPAAAYRAIAFLSETLDWLNPWHSVDAAAELNGGVEPPPQQHLYPHL